MNGSESISPGNDSVTPKRKNEEGAPQTRAKRNRYISIACNECKRRKIKCNGQTPCQRCGNLSLDCLYAPNCCSNFKDSEEFKRMDAHIAALQEQVETLFSNLSALRSQIDSHITPMAVTPYGQPQYPRSMSMPQGPDVPLSPSHSRRPGSVHPIYQGPTSSAFNLGVARSSLQTMGITGPDESLEEGVATQDATPYGSPPPQTSAILPKPIHASKDPIWAVGKEEAVRLCHVWQDEMGLMYPVLDIDRLIRHATLLYTFMDAASRTGLMQAGLPGADAIKDDQTSILKLVLATAMVLEGSGKSELGERLFQHVHALVERQLEEPVNIIGIQMLCVTAMYHFHLDDESRAWRIIGLTARLCMELGLHRRETYNILFMSDEERASAIKLFWSIYVLDRRWSFGTGMPFALQDPDIDPLLPKPDESTPYLAAMVTYGNIGSKVWRSVANVDSIRNNITNEEIGYLDYQVIQWINSVPESLKYIHPDSGQEAEPSSRSNHRLRVLLYLRANQMRILIYRPVLHTATRIMENLSQAQTVVDVAKETIRCLTHMNQTSDLYRTQQVMFNYFLISALAVLFLAVSHAPAQFSNHCRDEFYMALELVRGLSANSYVSKRLWKTIRVLKEVGPKLGLNVRQDPMAPGDAHSAAVAMAGLAGHPIDEMAIFGNGQTGYSLGNSPNGMANDLTSLFEAAGGYSNIMPNGFVVPAGEVGTNGGSLPGLFGHEDELSRILRDLF